MNRLLLLFTCLSFSCLSIGHPVIPAESISNEKLMNDSDCVAIGQILSGEMKDYFHIEMDVVMSSSGCPSKIIKFTIGSRNQGYMRYPILGQHYLVILNSSNAGFWVHPAHQSLIALDRYSNKSITSAAIEEISKEDKVPVDAFISKGNDVWLGTVCDSYLTYNGLVDPCKKQTSIIRFFINKLEYEAK